MIDDHLMTTEDAAKRLGVSVSKLAKDRVTGASPPFVKIGAAVRYRPADLDEFIAARIRRSTSEASDAPA
jgi:predicted DNA-binding transcriptional regulator AlpA